MSDTKAAFDFNFGDPESMFGEKKSFEDGTNLALGTPFQEEFTTRVLPWYTPAEAKGTHNWRENLSKLRIRFDNFIDEHCATECFLIQSLIPQSGEVPQRPPGILPDRKLLCSGPGLRREPARLFGIPTPNAALFPMMNVRGEPFLEPDGKPMPFKLGLNRQVTVLAMPDGLRPLPIPRFTELLGDGKNVLFQLPLEISGKIWRNWQSGFSQRNAQFLWLDALFEMSWQCARGSLFHTERYAWIENGSVGLSGKGLFPRLPGFITSTPGKFAPHENGYPRAFYSKITDVARASIAAIDEIIESATGDVNTRTARSETKSDMKQGESSPKNSVFISYSHKDKKFLNDLLTHLKPFERSGQLTAWSDKQIEPGSKWFAEIQNAISRTKVAVLLVTAHFLASNFINEHELAPILKRAEEEGVRVLWIPVRDCSYKETPIGRYQAIVPPDKPLAEMKAERDKAWVKICKEIKNAIAT
ncbi:MAG TPA: toll/interleukin-1 receptor domain-containing protein [Verrucomicrobiae bacterium]|jgi:hypothetical protein|nr:toll/interleukin-1 receptor domain-containing protein [Verrucomicrobiae bacterium]